ncbi:similar to Saccharomyces cerevisiae YGL173C KEM1 Evolutionarily-conserved 5'-3' exonuclease component of cytoplasmic processing (P) bodies involved in mRNA decay [Maudiozyma saulgeensis]|uniref:5'-3' exoribonuclease 1 n=1 Tax=Maudiozyma saulgeensis TaxID=1789683 RepID=A0A1X7QZ72_9SACH|nr:similar to Saccharomyces cerevisiae YGL173C KEM1 Evolutionarily-conserved 5'-3' exonuclease component of cytoplasmic processing (P) bodies involved in mRNA decay [Kazachstania saulgeensis]
MGIPKFFRYISERWPMISQLIEGNDIPEFDNLYLDMNSILHNCTHGNDDDITKRLSEEEVFARIFSYVDHLFQTIKPQKVFYMAIDGVAPRAKMNQQRARRFRTAMDAEHALQKAIEHGEPIPSGEPFDSNCITPGTEFMAKLTTNLKYYVHDKVTNDSRWRNVEIIFSGHEVPGEGEHKIMDFIRKLRAQDGFDNNTRHCIYGLDADLIMLSLSAHAPHFALLREEVTFGRRSKQQTSLETQNFYLLHISLLREYLELEFNEISDELKFKYDFERILDDFILIMFVIGNDFLPNLPDLHLNKGAFPVILQTFKEALLHLDGYINEHGKINLHRLKVWLDYLSQFELMNFEKKDIDVEWFNQQLENISLEGERKRARMGKKLLLKQQKKIVGFVKPWVLKIVNDTYPLDISDENIPTIELADEHIIENLPFLKEFAHELGLFVVHSKSKDEYYLKLDVDGINPNETEDEKNDRITGIRKTIRRYQQAILVEDSDELDREQALYNDRFEIWKENYYQDKFGYTFTKKSKKNSKIHSKPIDEDAVEKQQIAEPTETEKVVDTEIEDEQENNNRIDDGNEDVITLTKNYVEGLQWVLYYYYRGCPSWGWYFQYHYAPRISDLSKGIDQIIKFDLGEPFTPFQQLMAVLPERSKTLLPPALRPLMYDPKSPILDFYPAEVELDKNGKTADWEAVVKISFVDQHRLVEAMAPYLAKLSPEEKKRNGYGKDLIFTFNPQIDEIYKSPLSGIFGDIEHNQCIEREYTGYSMDGIEYKYGLLPNAKSGAELLAGFPTLATIPYKNKLEYNESLVFQQPSKQQSMCLYIEDIYEENNLTIEELAKRYLNKVIYTRWPYLRESKLLSISTGKKILEFKENKDANGKHHFKIIERPCDNHEQRDFESQKRSMLRNFKKKSAVILDDIRAIINVLPVTGLMRNEEGAYMKTFGEIPENFPLQLMVETVTNKDERYIERPPKPINIEFPMGSRVIFLGDYAYGGETTIDDYSSERRLKITVKKRFLQAEPMIGKERVKQDNALVQYIPSYIVSKKLNINRLFLSRITSKFLISDVDGKRVDIGIPVKFESQHKKVLGYARRNTKGWEYSTITMNLLREYRIRFPDFFARMEKVGNDIPSIEKLYPEMPFKESVKILDQVKAWLKHVTENFVTVSLESDSLTKASIAEVENYIIANVAAIEQQSETKQLAKVPRDAVLNPRDSLTLLRSQKFSLGDRVIYVQDSGKVPLFSRGTVVGYTTLGANLSIQVLFDHEIIAGNTFGGRLRTKRGIGLDSSFLLNITNRQFIYHSRASKKHTTTSTKQTKVTKEEILRRKQIQHQKAEIESDNLRKKAAHDLLNVIQKKEPSKSEENKVVEEATEVEAKKLQSLENKSKVTTKIDQTAPLPNTQVANSVFYAVLNQYDPSTAPAPAIAPQVMSHPTSHTLDPAGLPYHLSNDNAPPVGPMPGAPPMGAHPVPMGFPMGMNGPNPMNMPMGMPPNGNFPAPPMGKQIFNGVPPNTSGHQQQNRNPTKLHPDKKSSKGSGNPKDGRKNKSTVKSNENNKSKSKQNKKDSPKVHDDSKKSVKPTILKRKTESKEEAKPTTN